MSDIGTLRGRQVLVTGANGFVGGALVARLLADGAQVRGLVRSTAKGAELSAQGAEPVVGDLADSDALRRAVAGCDVVFNVGAALHGAAAYQYTVNVTGVRWLVDAAHDAGVGRLVHVSSVAVYGYDRPGMLDESMPPLPGVEFYGQSKALGERALLSRAAELGVEGVVIRPGMIYGPRSGFWTGLLFDYARRAPVLLPGDGMSYCPVVFIDDLVDLLVTAALHPGAIGEVFNAVSDEPVTWRAFLGAYARMAGHQSFLPLPVWVLRGLAPLVEGFLRLTGEPQPVRGMVDALLVRRRGYSMNKAARLLGWSPRVTLSEGMAQAEMWLRETGRLAG